VTLVEDALDLVFPGHGETPLGGGFLLEVGSGFKRLLDGEGMYKTIEWRGQTLHEVRRAGSRCAQAKPCAVNNE
jgi:hypothetical protein